MIATFAKIITKANIVMFSGISGHINAVRLSEECATSMPFKGRVVLEAIGSVKGVAVVEGEAHVKIESLARRPGVPPRRCAKPSRREPS
ncbi:MAG: hypothetical protein IPN53_02765 [Comamonadaceae bacterium]|nr:hypothetical protein [Comamonadaceae bacterium]